MLYSIHSKRAVKNNNIMPAGAFMSTSPKTLKLIRKLQELVGNNQYKRIISILSREKANVKDHYQVRKIQAIALLNLGRYTVARDILIKLQKNHPEEHDIKHNLAIVFNHLSELQSAINQSEQAVAMEPANLSYQLQLSKLYKLNRNIEEAMELLRNVNNKSPNDYAICCELADLLNNTGNYSEALHYLKNIQQSFYCLLLQLRALINLNHYDEAISIVAKAQEKVEPKDEKLVLFFANMLIQLGMYQESQQLLVKIDGASSYEYLTSLIRSGLLDEAALDNVLLKTNLSGVDKLVKKELYFSASNEYFRLKNNTKGFTYCHQANQLIDTDIEYKKGVDAIYETLTNTFSQPDWPDYAGSNSELPVFIIGMPRSGTTLLENIIATHSEAFGAGETPYIWLLLNNMDYYATEHINQKKYCSEYTHWDSTRCQYITSEYLKRLSSFDRNANRIVDKLPHNFLHLGMIKFLFPKARVIHIKRNPISTCMSIYKQSLASFHDYGTDLTYLADYYKRYLNLMDFWRARISHENFLEIEYETLVLNFEQSVRDVLSYVGLPFEQSCLDFHESKRAVVTASRDQVRNKIYKSSLTPWLGVEDQVKQLIDAFPEEAKIRFNV